MAHDRLLLVPPSGMLASLAFVAIGLWLLPRALPGLGRATRWLTLLVLLSNFVVQCSMGVLFRATKPLVAPLLLALLLLVLAEYRQQRLAPRAAFAAVFSLGLALSLLDRQGLFYLLALTLALGVAWLRERRGTRAPGRRRRGVLRLARLLPRPRRAAHPRAEWLLAEDGLSAPATGSAPGERALAASDRPARRLDLRAGWRACRRRLLAIALLAGCAFWAWRERRNPRRVALGRSLRARRSRRPSSRWWR